MRTVHDTLMAVSSYIAFQGNQCDYISAQPRRSVDLQIDLLFSALQHRHCLYSASCRQNTSNG